MTPALGAVDPSSILAKVGPVDDSEADLLRSLLHLFPIPRPSFALLLVQSTARIAESVGWLEPAFGLRSLRGLTSELERKLLPAYGQASRRDAADLTGVFLPARAIIGKDLEPQSGPEALRAALFLCSMKWLQQGKRRLTAEAALAAAIRELTEHKRRDRSKEPPLSGELTRLGAATSLVEFIDVARVISTHGAERLATAWIEHFEPALADIVVGQGRPSVQPDPTVLGPRDGASKPQDQDESDEVMPDPVRLPGGYLTRDPDDPEEENTPPVFIQPVREGGRNEDSKRVARYLAGQAIWNSNSLLLTQHPDALPIEQFRVVVRTLLDELARPATSAELGLGLVGLLLQAITGRSPRRLGAVKILNAEVDTRGIGECGLSLASAFIEQDVAWRMRKKRESARPSFFTPGPGAAKYFEQVATEFRLPIPLELTHVLAMHEGTVGKLSQAPTDTVESSLRHAARHVAAIAGFPFVAGQVRRSFAVHVYEECRDVALTQLISADTLGQSEASLHYYAPRKRDVAGTYWKFLRRLLDIQLAMPKGSDDTMRIGAAGLVAGARAKGIAARSGGLLNTGVATLIKDGRWCDIHEAMVTHLACMFLVIAGHRPVNALFLLTLADVHLDTDGGVALFRDKVHDAPNNPRLAVLAPCLVKQLTAYLEHLKGLSQLQPGLAAHVRDVLNGHAPLLFRVDETAAPAQLSISSLRVALPDEWAEMPLNWGRTWIRTRGLEDGLPPEWASVQLGHLEAVGYPFSNAGPTVPDGVIGVLAPHLELIARRLGWRVRRGIPADVPVRAIDPPVLERWSAAVSAHEAEVRAEARQWRRVQAAGIADYRNRAREIVLTHPLVVERGIAGAYHQSDGPWSAQAMTRAEAEALRDALLEAAGEDMALGIACSRAVRHIVQRVNKRLGVLGEDPSVLGYFRRPLDNAFVPGMMHAVRQVRALRKHAAVLGAGRPGKWRDFARACARAAYVLAVFGYLDDPDQIEGAIRNRASMQAPASLADVVLVKWGSRTSQVLGLRGLAAVALARLAKRYPLQKVPDRAELEAALAEFMPDWALPKPRASSNGLLTRLCETVGVANRYELSSAARFALDTKAGATEAAIEDQLALIDGDPVGTISRPEDPEEASTTQNRNGTIASQGSVNARSQYVALCRILPTTGKSLALSLTGVFVEASQLAHGSTRPKVIAEVDAMLADSRSGKVLCPAVRLLAEWVRQMLVEGTPAEPNPADRTIQTYLTRIGGTLVEFLGSGSLGDLDEVELEQIYRAAILSQRTNQSQTASSLLEFHRCTVRHYDLPDVDLSEVRSYLRETSRSVDAELILPQERAALIKHACMQAHLGGGVPPEKVRTLRQAASVLPLYAWGGARRAEALGLRWKDVWFSDECTGIQVRRNRSRRLKTPAARRTLLFDAARHAGIQSFTEWLQDDADRVVPWRRPMAYVFSPLMRPWSGEGRDSVASACIELVSAVTGRRRERLHRFRHLVAFEWTVPQFFSDTDFQWATVRMPNVSAQANNQVILPRDVMERVLLLGHVDWRTTIRSYLHISWLLRSQPDELLATTHLKRREVAFAMGVTLQAVDKIAQENKGKPPRLAWFDHVRVQRIVQTEAEEDHYWAEATAHPWTALEVDSVLQISDRMGLAKALRVSGRSHADYGRIRRLVEIVEMRIGGSLSRNGGSTSETPKTKRVVRRTDSDLLTEILGWFDQCMPNEQRGATQLVDDLMETMSPQPRHEILGDQHVVDKLTAIMQKDLMLDIRVQTSTTASQFVTATFTKRDKSGTSINNIIKRAIATAWIALHLDNDSSRLRQ